MVSRQLTMTHTDDRERGPTMTRTRNLARDLATLRRVSQRLSEAMPEALEQAEQAAASRREPQALALAVEKGLRRILCSEIREAAEMLTGALSQARTYLTGSAELGSDLGQVGVGVELALEARDSELCLCHKSDE